MVPVAILTLAVAVYVVFTLTDADAPGRAAPAFDSGAAHDELTPSEVAMAADIAAGDPLVAALAPEGAFDVVARPALTRNSVTVGASLILQLAAPVDSAGPWRLLRCQGTRVVEVAALWRNIHALDVTIDLERREVVSVGIGPSADGALADPSLQPLPNCPRRLRDKAN